MVNKLIKQIHQVIDFDYFQVAYKRSALCQIGLTLENYFATSQSELGNKPFTKIISLD